MSLLTYTMGKLIVVNSETWPGGEDWASIGSRLANACIVSFFREGGFDTDHNIFALMNGLSIFHDLHGNHPKGKHGR